MIRQTIVNRRTRNNISSSQKFYRAEPQPYHHVVRWTPILYAWTVFFSIYSNLDSVFFSVIFQYISYLAIAAIWLLAFYSITTWMKVSNRTNLFAVRTLLVSIFVYMFGLLVAINLPSFSLLRREFVSVSSTTAFVIILLVAPSSLNKLRLRMQWVILITSIAGTIFLLLSYWQSWGTTIRLGRETGIFYQGSISGMWTALGVWLLLFRGSSFNFSKPVFLSLALVISFANLLTGSFLGLTLIGLAWFSYLLGTIRHFALRGALFSFLFVGLLIYAGMPTSSTLISNKFINRRSTALVDAIQTKDFSYIYNAGTFSLRLAMLESSIAELPNYVFRGKGLGLNDVWVDRMNALGRSWGESLPVHNALSTLWLTAGGVAVIPYLLFIFAVARVVWRQDKSLMTKSWKFSSVFGIFLTIFAVTNPYDTTLMPYLIMLICISDNFEE